MYLLHRMFQRILMCLKHLHPKYRRNRRYRMYLKHLMYRRNQRYLMCRKCLRYPKHQRY